MSRFLPGWRMFLLITIAHLILSVVLLIFGAGGSIDEPTSPLQHAAILAAKVLLCPLVYPLEANPYTAKTMYALFPGLLGYVPMIVNSAPWSLIICVSIRRIGYLKPVNLRETMSAK